MEWKWNYGQGVVVLPAAVLSADATPEQTRVLLWLASDPTLFEKPAQLAKLAGCARDEVKGILQFWLEAGILSDGEGDSRARPTAKKATSAPKPTPPKSGTAATEPQSHPADKILRRADELPNYTSDQLADLLESSQSMRMLINEAQKIWGKVFNPYEVQLLVGLSDYLRLDDEYILLLLAHCKRIEKKSLRAVERYAISLVDNGVTTAAELEEFVRTAEERRGLMGKVRAMFGMGSRAFSAKETAMLDRWISYGYGEEIIRRAYEITVDAIHEPSLAYANSILERWHGEGLDTATQIDAKLDADREKKGEKAVTVGSFDTDDFFEAALRRSFSDIESENDGATTDH